MKVAIPIFGLRVSPRFDFAPGLWLFTVEDGRVVDRGEMALAHLSTPQRLERLRELGVEALICGGIDGHSAQILKSFQIEVTAWVAGDAEEAMQYFLRGELKAGSNLGPGCGRNRLCRGRRSLFAGKNKKRGG